MGSLGQDPLHFVTALKGQDHGNRGQHTLNTCYGPSMVLGSLCVFSQLILKSLRGSCRSHFADKETEAGEAE